MRDRRTVLRGLAALPLAAAPAVTLPALAGAAAPEPIVAMLARARALHHIVDRGGLSDERSDAAYDKMVELRDAASEMPVATMAGAVAVLAWARAEFAENYVDKADPDHLDVVTLRFIDVVTLRFIDGALGAMRQAVEGGWA